MPQNFYTWINSKYDEYMWTGSKSTPTGDSRITRNTPSVTATTPGEQVVTTRMDCYVIGSYVPVDESHGGNKIFTIKERYSIEVTFTKSSMLELLERVRNIITQQFKADNPDFNITEIFIPEPISPVGAPESMFHHGGKSYRFLTRNQEGRFRLSTEKFIYKSKAMKILNKYKLRNKSANVNFK